MGVLITSANFVGKFAIPQDSFSGLDAFINASEESYLVDLLGASLYADFKGNLSNKIPQATNYITIYNPFFKDYGVTILKSKGMVNMLVGFIYFDYMQNIRYKATSQGIGVTQADTTQNSTYGNLYVILNEALETYQAIQDYILYVKPEDYEAIEFNGVSKSYAIPNL